MKWCLAQFYGLRCTKFKVTFGEITKRLVK
jgi:hypothetical protein